MSKFSVFQFHLSDEDTDLVNAKGWDASPKLKAYMDARFGKLDKSARQYYDHVADIEATSLNQVFDIGNIGPESAISRRAPMSSVSVGDIIMDDQGDLHMVASFGFTKI